MHCLDSGFVSFAGIIYITTFVPRYLTILIMVSHFPICPFSMIVQQGQGMYSLNVYIGRFQGAPEQ